ncbi:MAG: SIS domain-containing protein, partial [Defluviitaleaceae bacterium]|nr:SIS domain-containing protein [Defluviitaleaceae bacterium]
MISKAKYEEVKKRAIDFLDKHQIVLTDEEKANIEAAGQIMADSVANGGCIHLFDTGHLIDSELLNRAGGLVLMRRFR